MASVTAVLTVPEAHALYRAVGQLADSLDDDPDTAGGPRTRGQKMADVLLDLVLRPGETELPPVQVLLTLVASVQTALGGDAPGELDGQVVPAELVRDLLDALSGNRAVGPPPPAADPPPPGVGEEPDDWWAEIERRVLADELPDQPDVVPDEVLAGWAAEALAVRGGPALPPAPDAPSPFTRVLPRSGPGPEPAPPSGQWWAAADRAVDAVADAARAADAALVHARRLVRTAVAADAADQRAWRASPFGRASAAADALGALAAASAERREELGALLSATGGGGLAERPRIAVVEALSGTFLALSDLPGLRRAAERGTGLRPPGPTDGYRPSRELDRWIRARDRRCRFPGCRRRVPRGGELDHQRRYPEGPTSASNLAGFCTADHRGKHQAPGWSYELAPGGTLTVITPSGLTAPTDPPPY